jgi:hypothetical protein
MTVIWKDIAISSNVARLGYDDETNELFVDWQRTHKISAYSDVPPAVFDQAFRAPSVGTFVQTEIKPNYPHRYVA